ncbi:MAG TPA: hypothetical protein VMY38_02540 [Gemmatimonadaceae bacterium]|nr:hypothetical protein [Gemmatimonadaceae bacterium]
MRVVACLFALFAASGSASAQIVLVDQGPGEPGRTLAAAIAGPHTVMYSEQPVALPRDSVFTETLIVLAPRVTVASTVRGDVIVVGGDLFMHPGGNIEGRAIAIGGGAYNSTLATVRDGRYGYRDATFDLAADPSTGTFRLSYRSLRVDAEQALLTWPLRVGLRIPSYNRVDGLILPWGPIVTLSDGRFIINPTITYRSHLGNFDPGIAIDADFGRLDVDIDARRSTFSNDKWIRGDLMNSLTTLAFGTDTRNYFRADRIEATGAMDFAFGNFTVAPFIGGLFENAWSTGGSLGPDTSVFSLFGKDDEGIYRPNPGVVHGHIASLLTGFNGGWSSGDFTSRLSARVEYVLSALPSSVVDDFRFMQTTLDGRAAFSTFGSQRLELKSHAVLTTGDTPPPQRYAYIGGSGTIPTLDLLEMGGDQLFFFDAAYVIPIERFSFKFVGSPQVTLRFISGSAGISELPDFVQNVGVRVGFPMLGVEYLVDPASGESKISFGFSMGQ